jgi:hypothetical protein
MPQTLWTDYTTPTIMPANIWSWPATELKCTTTMQLQKKKNLWSWASRLGAKTNWLSVNHQSQSNSDSMGSRAESEGSQSRSESHGTWNQEPLCWRGPAVI